MCGTGTENLAISEMRPPPSLLENTTGNPSVRKGWPKRGTWLFHYDQTLKYTFRRIRCCRPYSENEKSTPGKIQNVGNTNEVGEIYYETGIGVNKKGSLKKLELTLTEL